MKGGDGMKGRFALGAFIASTISIGGIAWAAQSPVQSDRLSSGLGTVAACDHAPSWTYTFSKDGNGRVDEVVVGGIAASCAGGTMRLTLAGPSLSTEGTPVVVTSCPSTCSALVPFVVRPLPSQVTSASGVIVGP